MAVLFYDEKCIDWTEYFNFVLVLKAQEAISDANKTLKLYS